MFVLKLYGIPQIMGQGQLTVKGSSNRMLPRFQEPILGQVRLSFLESRKHSIRGTLYRQLPLIPNHKYIKGQYHNYYDMISICIPITFNITFFFKFNVKLKYQRLDITPLYVHYTLNLNKKMTYINKNRYFKENFVHI